MRGWRPLLRLAWRDVLRSKGRSALVLVLIALPVLAVTTALSVMTTAELSGGEALERRLGAADARISFDGSSSVLHAFDPDTGSAMSEGSHARGLTEAGMAEVLGREVRAIPWRQRQLSIRDGDRSTSAIVSSLDLADPLAEGLARLEEGRLPASPREALVNPAFVDRGVALGDTLTLADGTTLQVVGIGEDAAQKGLPALFAPPGTEAGAPRTGTWLLDAGDVTWPEVRALNEHGATVLSRAVLVDPPPDSELPAELQDYSGSDDGAFAVVVLVVVMVLLEVVLLAGPAFAVTARRQSRTLALMAAVGGTPSQARRTILSIAVVLGGLAALVGVAGGILFARLVAVPVAQHYSSDWFGPFDVPWLWVLVVAAFGLASALLAAAVPARLASRMDVVAVLAGRRGDAAPSRRSPLMGLALLGAGVAGAVLGASEQAGGEVFIASSAIVCVLGMILLVPVVLGALARLGGRLPLPLRYAVRDAVRHRTRTVPAVAAVAATVCGVVALGISTSSDAKESEATYSAQLVHGDGVFTTMDATAEQWTQVEQVLRRELPEATVTPVIGVPERDSFVDVSYRVPGQDTTLLAWAGGTVGTMNLVGDQIPTVLPDISAAERQRGNAALAAGDVVVFTNHPVDAETVRIEGSTWEEGAGEAKTLFGPTTLPATYVEVDDTGSAANGVVPSAVAAELGMEAAIVSVHVSGATVSKEQQEAVEKAVAGIGDYPHFYVERGYVPDDATRLVLWVLGGLGGVLMLGGTLTVTFLALSDARPDLATLAAVGAAPRTRRAVAASYALVVGFVGAVLGALVGFVPGIAVTYPLTRSSGIWTIDGQDMSSVSGVPPTIGPFLEIPWLMIAVVVLGLPLLTALVVGLCARSRLPMVARLD
ncbi:FtsX-like permease family protein [Nocardioides houyundeii]|uniref:FtsX-like permease family protein n=1 Tax=Nocardioides houyundeii TaxID=2045452 RepID=UPI000DF38964|nr:FtsX-like permease family protein [Nocardioides houyundeii]